MFKDLEQSHFTVDNSLSRRNILSALYKLASYSNKKFVSLDSPDDHQKEQNCAAKWREKNVDGSDPKSIRIRNFSVQVHDWLNKWVTK